MGKTLRWLAVLALVLSLSCVLFPAYGQEVEEVVSEEPTEPIEEEGGIGVGGDEMLEGEEPTAEEIAEDFETEKALEAQVGAENAKREAESALSSGDCELAVAKLKEAVDLVPDDEQTLDRLKEVQSAYVYDLLKAKKYTGAVIQADDFLARFTDPDDLQVVQVKNFRETAAALLEAEPTEEIAEAVEKAPRIEKRTDTELLARAIQAYRKKDYDVAKDLLLDAREINAYNIEVDRWLDRVNYQIYLHQRAVRETLRREMVLDVMEVWTRRPRRPVVEAGPITPPEGPEETEARREILRKLDMIIPEVDFKDAELREVINFLAREADVNIVIDPVVFLALGITPTGPGEEGPFEEDTGFPGEGPFEIPGGEEPGVGEFAPQGSMIPPGGGAGPAPGGGFGPGPGGFGPDIGGVPPVGGYALPQSTTITIQLTNVPLKYVLKYVLRYKNLKYVVEDYAILIIPIDYVLPEELETEIFRLSTSGIGTSARIGAPTGFGAGDGEIGGGFGGGDGGFGGGFGEEAGAGQPENIEEWLKRAGGVTWPTGSNIVYHQSTATLIVTNTPTNMVLIRELIKIWDRPPMQVAIEARFLEVKLNRQFENSFLIGMTDYLRWTRRSDAHSPVPGMGTLPLASRERIELLADPTKILRVTGSSILDIKGILTRPEFRMIWYALEQSDYAELLSAPSVTTISGQQALIQVVQEIRYPTEYETESLEDVYFAGVDVSDFAAFYVTASSFETREVGIRLNVTPTVSSDGEVITLVLLPEVSKLVEWINYGTLLIPQQQPIFESRNVTTTVYINDGETLVIGGIIESRTDTFSDRVPFLGSIPLLGRLFRSEWESEKKANLMIFVTADLITSRGTHVKQEREITEQRMRFLEQYQRELEAAEEEGTALSSIR